MMSRIKVIRPVCVYSVSPTRATEFSRSFLLFLLNGATRAIPFTRNVARYMSRIELSVVDAREIIYTERKFGVAHSRSVRDQAQAERPKRGRCVNLHSAFKMRTTGAV